MGLYVYQSDEDIVQDFIRDYRDLYQTVESNILTLEASPDDKDVLNSLFRGVHTIKGNCGLLGIYPLVELLQDLETILGDIRAGDMAFQTNIGDLVLLVMDRCTGFLDDLEFNETVEFDEQLYHAVATQIQKVCEAGSDQKDRMITKALLLLDPTISIELEDQSAGEQILQKYDIQPDEDLLYVFSMAEHSQNRAVFWKGRLARVLEYVLSLNEFTGKPVEPIQLFVSACMHDIAMSMLPTALLHKSDALTLQETKLIQEHVWIASRLVSSFPQWKEAKRIIDHHQENFDGSGYPLSLKGIEICTGAQFLAIAHVFETIAHGYAKSQSSKRPLMRAVLELNHFSGVQFNPKLVEAFMQVMRAREK